MNTNRISLEHDIIEFLSQISTTIIRIVKATKTSIENAFYSSRCKQNWNKLEIKFYLNVEF